MLILCWHIFFQTVFFIAIYFTAAGGVLYINGIFISYSVKQRQAYQTLQETNVEYCVIVEFAGILFSCLFFVCSWSLILFYLLHLNFFSGFLWCSGLVFGRTKLRDTMIINDQTLLNSDHFLCWNVNVYCRTNCTKKTVLLESTDCRIIFCE